MQLLERDSGCSTRREELGEKGLVIEHRAEAIGRPAWAGEQGPILGGDGELELVPDKGLEPSFLDLPLNAAKPNTNASWPFVTRSKLWISLCGSKRRRWCFTLAAST